MLYLAIKYFICSRLKILPCFYNTWLVFVFCSNLKTIIALYNIDLKANKVSLEIKVTTKVSITTETLTSKTLTYVLTLLGQVVT